MLRGRVVLLAADGLAGSVVAASLGICEDTVRKWINEQNKNPRPFAWTKSADDILETLAG